MNTEDIKNFIQELLEKTSVTVKDVTVAEEGPNTTWFRVEVGEPHLFLGRDAEALSALNHIVRRVVENKSPARSDNPDASPHDSPAFFVDINGYQKARIENIRALAHMMAERARYFKSSVEIDPMSSFDRRVVHEFLADAADLKTESEGVGPSRRVVIRYIGSI